MATYYCAAYIERLHRRCRHEVSREGELCKQHAGPPPGKTIYYCGATTRAGTPCRQPVPRPGGRCPEHPDEDLASAHNPAEYICGYPLQRRGKPTGAVCQHAVRQPGTRCGQHQAMPDPVLGIASSRSDIDPSKFRGEITTAGYHVVIDSTQIRQCQLYLSPAGDDVGLYCSVHRGHSPATCLNLRAQWPALVNEAAANWLDPNDPAAVAQFAKSQLLPSAFEPMLADALRRAQQLLKQAEDADTSEERLEQLLDPSMPEIVRAAVARRRHPPLSNDIKERLMRDGAPDVRETLVEHQPDLTPQQLHYLFSDSDLPAAGEGVCASMAPYLVVRRPDCPIDILAAAPAHPAPAVRFCAAGNPHTPAMALEQIMEQAMQTIDNYRNASGPDPEAEWGDWSPADYATAVDTLQALATNPSTPPSLHYVMIQNGPRSVVRSVLANPGCPEDIIRTAAQSPDDWMRKAVIDEVRGCPPDVLEGIINDLHTSNHVRVAARARLRQMTRA